MKGVSRTAISIPSDLMDKLNDLLPRINVKSRSKAISEAISLYIAERYWILSEVDKEVAGAILIVYDHHKGSDVTEIQHKHFDLIRSTSHVHIDEERCLEVVIILGSLSKVKQLFAELQSLRAIETIKPFLIPLGGREESP
ncbi:MAG: nickel-responsive transcriptional regulator NikR [Candidatus Korarchaeum sp.]|nr:nickel-responsive transcriptional regulator NikR [Candidatus Korarchaeum sp.]MDW8035475.1 nickel-responsive transcriptional regulator NikR [Candidatus Korarchaeum sp.]